MALAPPASRLLTYDDLQELPDDGRRHELLDGMLVVTPAPGGPHQVVVGALYRLLHAARSPGTSVLIAPVDLLLSQTTVLQPDVVVVEAAEALEHKLTLPPLLVAEVLSPSTRAYDLGSKMLTYAAAGIGWYWVVDPTRPVDVRVFRLDDGRYEEVGGASGDERLTVEDPYALSLTPSELLAL
ncbi:MAG: Uma2 family endonuclease [Acidimicrobiales bacterium]